MKTILILAIGIAPLAVLTASSLFGRGPAAAAPAAEHGKGALDLTAADVLAKGGTAAAAKEKAVAQRLVDLEVFRDGLLPPLTIDGAGDRYKPIEKSWTELKKAEEACAALAKVYRTPLTPEDESKAIEAYLGANPNPLAGLNGGDDLEAHLREKLSAATEKGRSAKLLAGIRVLNEKKRYSDCLREIALLKLDALTAAEREEVEQIRKKSAFKDYWKELPPSSSSAKTRCAVLEELLSKSPPDADAEDRDFVKRRSDDVVQLRLQARIDELFETPPDRLRDLLAECGRILDDYMDDKESKGRLRDGVRKWLEKRITAMQKPPSDPRLKEAWYKDGRRLQGIFAVDNPGAMPTRYRYWETIAAKTASPNTWEKTIYLSELRKEPAKLTDVRVSEDFNVARQKFLKKLDSERNWQDFAKICETLQAELSNYSDTPKAKSGAASLGAYGNFAKEAIEEWATFGKLFK